MYSQCFKRKTVCQHNSGLLDVLEIVLLLLLLLKLIYIELHTTIKARLKLLNFKFLF